MENQTLTREYDHGLPRREIGRSSFFHYSLMDDIRNPINQVKGLLMKLKDSYERGKEAQQLLNLAIVSNQILFKKVEMLLEEDVTKTIINDSIDFIELVSQAQDNFEKTGELKGIKVIKNIEDNIHYEGDSVLLYALIKNLIYNAIKHKKPDSNNAILVIGIRKEKEEIFIKISDNGIGLNLHEIPHIFEKVSGKSKLDIASNLYAIKSAVDELEATIQVRSEIDLGTIFTIKLPIK